MTLLDLIDYLMSHAEKQGDLPVYILIDDDTEMKLDAVTIIGYPIRNVDEPRILLVSETDEEEAWEGLP